MNEHNFYWPTYKNLEKELLELAKYIHFSDDQLEVYSIYIADLIVRCSIEIESISKELYIMQKTDSDCEDEKRKALYFDTKCLALLNKKWNIGKKKVAICTPNFHFSKEENIVFSPLKNAEKQGKRSNGWKKAYQALKHDRKNSLKKGTVRNLIHVMAALYILNIYYKDKIISVGNNPDLFDNRVGSDIFSVLYYRADGVTMTSKIGDFIISNRRDNLEEYTYIIRYDNNTVENMYENFRKDAEISRNKFEHSKEVYDYLDSNQNYEIESIEKTCIDMGREDLIEEFKYWQNSLNFTDCRYEAILNKNEVIYPDLEEK